jgi:hypothetical protein
MSPEELQAKPVIIGRSFGGLFAEKLVGQDLGIAGVAIDPAQIKGVLPLPLAQLRSALPALGNPAHMHKAVSLTAKEFRFGFAVASSIPMLATRSGCSRASSTVDGSPGQPGAIGS